MGHSINAIILKGEYQIKEADNYDLRGVQLDFGLTLFYIDGSFTAYWQKKLEQKGFLESNCDVVTWYPREFVIFHLLKLVSKTEHLEFALILTDYFGGVGQQFANVYKENKNVDFKIDTISKALKYLGVEKGDHYDEFDTIGLGKYRINPDYLGKYRDLASSIGV